MMEERVRYDNNNKKKKNISSFPMQVPQGILCFVSVVFSMSPCPSRVPPAQTTAVTSGWLAALQRAWQRDPEKAPQAPELSSSGPGPFSEANRRRTCALNAAKRGSAVKIRPAVRKPGRSARKNRKQPRWCSLSEGMMTGRPLQKPARRQSFNAPLETRGGGRGGRATRGRKRIVFR